MKLLFSLNTWQEIFNSIGSNMVRTLLTMFGVFWGIFVYITMSGVAKGLDNGFDRAFERVAVNTMFVWAQNTSKPYAGFKRGRSIELTTKDQQLLVDRVPDIEYIAPSLVKGLFGDGAGVVKRGLRQGDYRVYGEAPASAKISQRDIFDGGRYINEDDMRLKRKVAVIGERAKAELFEEDEEAVGDFIEIDGVSFQVIGVQKFVPGGPFNQDTDIFIPFETYRRLYNSGDRVFWYLIAAYDSSDVAQVEKDIKAILRNEKKVDPTDELAIRAVNLGVIFNSIKKFSTGMTLLSLIIGIATILAGVISIGNILLISVKERTKELGVRRALGARPGEVRTLIVLESLVLTLVSGVYGISFGALVLWVVNYFTKDIQDFPYTNPTVPVLYVVGALVIMVVFSTLIGLIPAQRAVSIKPIDALREE